MENINNNYLLIIGGIIAIIAELALGVATGFDLFVIGVIFIVSGGVGLLVSSFTIALILVSILCLAYVFVGRGFIKQKLTLTTKATNVDALIGKKGMVTKKITKDTVGQVKVEGEVWRAASDTDIDAGSTVVVESVSGVTLTVKPLSS